MIGARWHGRSFVGKPRLMGQGRHARCPELRFEGAFAVPGRDQDRAVAAWREALSSGELDAGRGCQADLQQFLRLRGSDLYRRDHERHVTGTDLDDGDIHEPPAAQAACSRCFATHRRF